MRHFLEKHLKANRSLLTIITIAGFVRLFLAGYLVSVRGPLMGIEIVFRVLCPFYAVIITCALVLLGVFIHTLWQTRSIVTPIFLVVGVFLIFQAPLPIVPTTPEERHFLKHRSYFEQAVDLVRNAESDKERSSLCDEVFEMLPEVFGDDCDAWFLSSSNSFVAVFEPFDFYHPLLYTESTDLDNPCVAADPFGWVEERIDEHWYVCMRDHP